MHAPLNSTYVYITSSTQSTVILPGTPSNAPVLSGNPMVEELKLKVRGSGLGFKVPGLGFRFEWFKVRG